MPKQRIKVVIVEDHAVVRQGLKILIHADPELCVTGEAEDGQAGVQTAVALRPDVVVMDLALPRMSGMEATKALLQKSPESKVLVLSSYGDNESVRNLLGAGAMGYITKHSASEDLLDAIHRVSRGERYLSPSIARRLERQERHAFMSGRAKTEKAQLSSRETEVLRLVAAGHATKEIARQLGLSVKTVEKHRQSVMDKLDIHEVAGLTRYASSKGLICLPAAPSPCQPSLFL